MVGLVHGSNRKSIQVLTSKDENVMNKINIRSFKMSYICIGLMDESSAHIECVEINSQASTLESTRRFLDLLPRAHF